MAYLLSLFTNSCAVGLRCFEADRLESYS